MLRLVYLGLVLLLVTPGWSQLKVTPFETTDTPVDESRMQTPPPVSAQAFPAIVGSQMRSNFLGAGLIFTTAYNNNVTTDGTNPVGDVVYSILPTISLDRTTPRQHLSLIYSPGFTFYQKTTSLNAAAQSAAFSFQYRLSEHTTISLSDSFQKSSNVFNQLYPVAGAGISGSTQAPSGQVVVPYADQLNNLANAGISYQFSRNRMVGADAVFTLNNYSNPAQAPGLYNSNGPGGSIFYSQRLSSRQYIGVTYQYLRSEADPVLAQTNPVNASTEVQTQTVLPFYTIYLKPTLSISISGGPQYYDASQSPSPAVRAWTPAAMASIGWQKSHTNLVASYARTVAGSVGLPGAFETNTTNASARWQIARTWNTGASGSYFTNRSLTPSFTPSNPGGHSIIGTVSVQHSMGEHFRAELGYSRLHQSYSGVAVISNAPDSNRVYISLSYQFLRPLGR
jgi:hypothetical protein